MNAHCFPVNKRKLEMSTLKMDLQKLCRFVFEENPQILIETSFDGSTTKFWVSVPCPATCQVNFNLVIYLNCKTFLNLSSKSSTTKRGNACRRGILNVILQSHAIVNIHPLDLTSYFMVTRYNSCFEHHIFSDGARNVSVLVPFAFGGFNLDWILTLQSNFVGMIDFDLNPELYWS